MGDLMRLLVAGRGWGERVAFSKLRSEWAGVVGASVAARSAPESLRRGVLTVRASSGAWATELTLLSRALAEKANAFLGGDLVREVRVSAGGPDGPAAGS